MAPRTSSAVLIALASVVLLGGGWFLFLAGSDDVGEEGLTREQAPALADPGATPAGELPAAGEGAAAAAAPGEGEGPVRVDVVEAARAEEHEAARAQLQWVEGRVVFDFTPPADEQLYVLSLDREFNEAQLYDREDLMRRVWGEESLDDGADDDEAPDEAPDDASASQGPLHDFARVAPDGSFRVGVRAGARQAHLALSGRYTYSRRTRAVAADAQGVVLTGELGAWVLGRLRIPGASQGDERLARVPVELGPDVTSSFDAIAISGQAYSVKTVTDDVGRFEFRGVSDTLARGIFARPEGLAGRLMLGLRPEPGERLELELALQEGATLRGTVLGEEGEPLAGAPVDVRLRGALGQGLDALREGETDADGRFELTNVMTGRLVSLAAEPEGWRAGKLNLEEKLRDGQVLDQLIVRCSRGLSISGRVLFPDGAPAAGADVRVVTDFASVEPAAMRSVGSFMADETTEADEEGRFRIGGLGEGKLVVYASIEESEGAHVGSWRTRVGGVDPASGALQLELEGLTPLRGELSTASELPIGPFAVRLTLSGSGGMMGIGAERRAERFDEPQDGGFTVENVAPGLWEVVVEAQGFAATPAVEVEVPVAADAAPLAFELIPAATVEGTVFDTAGKPVSGATVTIEQDLSERVAAAAGGGAPQAISDHEGRYVLEGLEPGGQSLLAKMSGFAASEARGLELEAGQRVEGVDLELRVGATILGEVLGDDGEPAPGRMVIVQVVPSYDRQQVATSGPDGDFRFEHLEPGSWQVISMANALTGELDSEDGQDMGAMLGGMKMDMVEVADGEELWVTLGERAEDPIEVLGSVAAGDEPIGDAVVVFVPEDSGGLGDMRMTTTNASGDFKLVLEKRGAYLVTVQADVSTGRQNSVEFDEVVPEEGSTHRVALRLPLGGIRGRVIDQKGDPAVDCRITLNVDDGIRFGSFLGGHYSEVVTDQDGRYSIEHLSPGRYSVSAGGATLAGLLGDDAVAGRVVRSGLVVEEGEWLEGVDFRLKRPGELRGHVRGIDGSPVAGAAVFVRDGQGRLLDHFSMVTSDASGSFVYRGVAEGEYRVVAKKGDRVSPPSDLVSVKAGGSASAEVRLEEGTFLLLKVTDKLGTEFRARVSVLDERGNEMCAMLSMEEILQQFGKGFSSKQQRVGPLPEGRYRVEATLDDGRTAYKNVTLSGQSERTVVLRVK